MTAMPPPVPVFEPGFYRTGNPGLLFATDNEAAAHYEQHGRNAGLIASPFATREGFLEFLRDNRRTLEIGPFCRPLLTGEHVDYLDVLDAAALRARAIAIGMDPSGCPERIHYVGDLAQVTETYDIVVSSHAIEHQPDLVAHLDQVARILRPGGFFALIVPDKRYCFDHFLPESTIAAVLAAHREGRRTHSVASVIEHGALVTHNDAARHWAGDHGDPAAIGGSERVRAAVERFDLAEGDYLDVHAWQFTPDSFRRIISDLNNLGLSRLEPIAVYDTPRDRMEFCALLQLRRPARRIPQRDHGLDVLFLQTADPFRYNRMLEVTAPNVIEYCRRHGFRYESYTGIRRGWWNWQATYNRIPMLRDLLDRGFAGWAVYVDADAYINDLDFDLPSYLAEHHDRAAIFATSGVTGEHWDINAGVAIINFSHPEGRRLVEEWAADFALIPDERLEAASAWLHGDNDQDLIQAILRRDAALAGAVHVESMDLLNSRHARFIRQHLRAQTGDFAERVRSVAAEIHDIFAEDGLCAADHNKVLDERGRFALMHPIRGHVRLVAASAAEPRLDLAEQAIAAWRGNADSRVADYQGAFAGALRRGDVNAVAAELAALGQRDVAQGFLGGARQHKRAETDPVFAYRRARRTYDALVSLAEVSGALPPENPDLGDWAENSAMPAERLVRTTADALGIDIAPPAQIGGYMGIAAGGTRVFHLRMIEAVHSAWRLRQTLELLGATGVVEIGGGAGFVGHYARRFGVVEHRIMDTGVMHAIQAFALGRYDPAIFLHPSSMPNDFRETDLLLLEDGFSEMDLQTCTDLLGRARDNGVIALLTISQEGKAQPGNERPTLREQISRVGGFRLAYRQRHALRPGYVEQLFTRV